MKVWIVTTEFPPHHGGGIATYCKHTVQMLTAYGHEVCVITPDEKVEDFVLENNHLFTIYRFKPGRNQVYRHMGYVAALSYDVSERIRWLMEKIGIPDVIECQDYLGIGYFLLSRKRTLDDAFVDVPIVVTLHAPKYLCDEVGQAPLFNFPDYWTGEMERYCLRAADHVISPSNFLASHLLARGELEPTLVSVVPNPFEPEDTEVHVKDDTAFVCLGRLQYIKGQDHLISQLSSFWDSGFPYKVKFVGGDSFFHPRNTSFAEYLKRKYQGYLERGLIEFEGLMPPEGVREIISKAGVLFVPSLFDNYPYTVLEAMAAGCIVVTSSSGGQREIVEHRKSGFLYSLCGDPTFSDVFRDVLALTSDEKGSIRRRAQQRVREVSGYEAVIERKLESYEAAIRTSKPNKYPFRVHIQQQPIIQTNRQPGMLSIVIPYYNMGEWIQDTLDSLMNITYQKYEIIVVDDGSNDPTSIKRLSDLERMYPIRVLRKQNEGLALTRNYGAAHAQGEFLAFLDADDCVEPTYYSRAICILKKYSNVSFVGSWVRYFGDSQDIWPTWDPEPPYLLVHNTVNSSGLVYRTDHFITHGLNDPKFAYGMEDYESVIRMVAAGCRGVVIPEPLFLYRVRPDSMSRQFNTYMQNFLYRLITEKHRLFYQSYVHEVANLLNNNGPFYTFDNPSFETRPPISPAAKDSFSGDLIPVDIKWRLFELWKSKMFRKTLKLLFRMRIDRLFSR